MSHCAQCSFQFGGWPAVSRRDSGNKDRVRGSSMSVLCMFHIHSLGTLHNPIGAVAPWCYIYTATSRIHRMYAGCLEYYTLIRKELFTGRTYLSIIMATNIPRFLRAGRQSSSGRGEMLRACTTYIFASLTGVGSYDEVMIAVPMGEASDHSLIIVAQCLPLAANGMGINVTVNNNAVAFQREGSAANPKWCRPTELINSAGSGNPPASAELLILRQWRHYKHP